MKTNPLIAREVLCSALTVNNNTQYTSAAKFYTTSGYACVLVVSTAGSITVTQQCSPNNVDWYDAVDSSGNALGAVVAAMTVGTKYIQYSPVLCEYIRFKVVEGGTASTNVTLTLIYN
jgi:hypothetical protein